MPTCPPTAPALLALLLTGCTPSAEPQSPDRRSPTSPLPTDQGPDAPTIDEISLHPELQTVVVVRWTQHHEAEAAYISWQLDGEAHASPPRRLPVGPAEEVLLGIPALTRVEPVLHVDGEAVALPPITTGALPANLSEPQLLASLPDQLRPEPWLLLNVDVGPEPFFGPWYTLILDRRGRIVWYLQTSDRRMSWQARPSALGGHLVIDASTTYTPKGEPGISRLTLDLAQRDEIGIPDLQFAFDELPDGSFLYAAGGLQTPYALRRRWPDGHTQTLWDCDPWMSQFSTELWACAANTVRHDPVRDTVLFSAFETHTVAEIDLATGALVAEYGQYPGGFDFEPKEAMLQHQHNPAFTAGGTLLTQTDSPSIKGQWAREYALDPEGGILQEIFSLPSNHHALYGGHVQVLASGHLLWSHGTAGVIEELTRDGIVVWAADFGDQVLGDATVVTDLYLLNQGW